jgi:plastocyanin
MRRAVAAALAAIAVAAAPGAASAAAVNIEFQAFSPSQIDVLPGESVEWTNSGVRRHTVTADDESFDSGDLFGGDRFSRVFSDPGGYAYHCTVHLSMTGEVDVRRVILDPLPPGPVPAGQPVRFAGRAADAGAPVTIERDTGDGFQAVATASPSADGIWSAAVVPTATADYRALSGSDASGTRRLLVTNRRLRVRATRAGLEVTVTPPLPNATVVLQLDLRDRFGWWPAARARLDYLSRAGFRIGGRVRARVALVDRDGWTPIATSPVLSLRRR